jgi:hypothetical protein
MASKSRRNDDADVGGLISAIVHGDDKKAARLRPGVKEVAEYAKKHTNPKNLDPKR